MAWAASSRSLQKLKKGGTDCVAFFYAYHCIALLFAATFAYMKATFKAFVLLTTLCFPHIAKPFVKPTKATLVSGGCSLISLGVLIAASVQKSSLSTKEQELREQLINSFSEDVRASLDENLRAQGKASSTIQWAVIELVTSLASTAYLYRKEYQAHATPEAQTQRVKKLITALEALFSYASAHNDNESDLTKACNADDITLLGELRTLFAIPPSAELLTHEGADEEDYTTLNGQIDGMRKHLAVLEKIIAEAGDAEELTQAVQKQLTLSEDLQDLLDVLIEDEEGESKSDEGSDGDGPEGSCSEDEDSDNVSDSDDDKADANEGKRQSRRKKQGLKEDVKAAAKKALKKGGAQVGTKLKRQLKKAVAQGFRNAVSRMLPGRDRTRKN